MILALDTATATASIALYDELNKRLLMEATWQARRRHTEELLATVEQWLRRLDLSVETVTALAVTTGPGSFTGVRIGISAVKGIGLGLPTPPRVLGVPTLTVTAAAWMAVAGSMGQAVEVCAYIQAGRGRYAWCFFDGRDWLRRPQITDHAAGAAQEFAYALARREEQVVWLAGEPDGDLSQAVAPLSHVCLVDAIAGLRRAGLLAQVAARHFEQGTEDDLSTLQPLYLKGP